MLAVFGQMMIVTIEQDAFFIEKLHFTFSEIK